MKRIFGLHKLFHLISYKCLLQRLERTVEISLFKAFLSNSRISLEQRNAKPCARLLFSTSFSPEGKTRMFSFRLLTFRFKALPNQSPPYSRAIKNMRSTVNERKERKLLININISVHQELRISLDNVMKVSKSALRIPVVITLRRGFYFHWQWMMIQFNSRVLILLSFGMFERIEFTSVRLEV